MDTLALLALGRNDEARDPRRSHPLAYDLSFWLNPWAAQF